MQSNNANEEQKKEFYKIAFGSQNELFDNEIIQLVLPKAIKKELESSNFEALENQITNVLFEKGNNILLKSIKEDLVRLIENTIDKIEVEKSGLDKDEAEIKRLINKITSISNRLNEIQIPDEFKKKVDQIIQPNFDAFKVKINSIVNSHFEGQFLHNPFIRRLREVLGFLNSYKKVNYQSEEEMRNHISDINNLFSSSIITEFEVFWNKIFSDIYEEFSFLSDELKQKAVPIINEIQNELKKELHISLFPYKKTIVKTDKYNFYHNLTYGTFNLITENKGWTLGWFFIFPYPKRYTESYTLNVSEYIQLLNEKTDEFLINQTNELWLNLTSNLEQVFQSSKNEISIYKDEYIRVLENAIQKQKNGINISELVTQMSRDLNISRNTLKEIEDLFMEKMQNWEKQNITNIEKQYNINKIENASFE